MTHSLPLTKTAPPIRSSKGIQLTPKQANIYQWGWQPIARFRTAACGRRFGKTFLAAKEIQRAVRLAVKRNVDTDNEIWYGAPTFKQAKRVFWRRLKKSIPPSWRAGKPNETDCSITLKSGHVIRIVGLENYDDLRGSGLWFFIGDEWADCKYECWTEVIRPMLSTCGGHALFIGTPKGFNHFYDGFVEGQPGAVDKDGNPILDNRSWCYTTLQGGNVPPKEVDAARRKLDRRTFQQEYEASFQNFAGRVYYAFLRTESVKACPFNPALPIHIGMDFNVNPMSAAIWQEQPGGEIWQIDEIVMPTSNTDEMVEEIASRYGKKSFEPLGKPIVDHITVYPDPAGAQRRTSAQGRTDISILRDRGFKVIAMESHPLVRDRVNVVNGKWQSADGKRHAFVDPKCQTSIKCYEQLIFKEGTNEPDKTLGLDHLPDATGYYLFGRFAYKAPHRTAINHLGR